MITDMKKILLIYLFISIVLTSCGNAQEKDQNGVIQETHLNTIQPKITFIELGSVNCIPCRRMQPIMKSIEKKYGDQIKVVFYDVWKDNASARKYGIRLIPTQVFLDENQMAERSLLFENDKYQQVPEKYKLLIGIAVAAALGSDTCTQMWTNLAKTIYVSNEEIVEGMMVARYMKQATVNDTICNTLAKLKVNG